MRCADERIDDFDAVRDFGLVVLVRAARDRQYGFLAGNGVLGGVEHSRDVDPGVAAGDGVEGVAGLEGPEG